MSAVPVTALYGGLLAIFFVFISTNVSRNRAKAKLFLDPGKPVPDHLHRAQRAQGNAAEYVPMGVVLLLALELSHGSWLWLHIFGGALLVARVSHAVGVLQKLEPAQILGATLTWLTLLVQGIYLLVLRFS